MEEQAKIRFLIRTAYFLTIAVGVFLICRFLFAYFLPFLVGILIAWAVQRPAAFLSKRIKLPKRTAALILAILLFLLAALLSVFLAYRGSISGRKLLSDLSRKLPELGDAFSRIRSGVKGIFNRLPQEISAASDAFYSGAVNRLAQLLTGAASSAAGWIVKRIPLYLFNTVIALAASCYIAIDFERLSRFLKGVIGRRPYENLCRIKEILKNSVFKLVRGYFILSMISFFLLLAGFFILQVKNPVIAALLIAAVDFLPALGTGAVLIPWGVTSFLLSDVRTGAGLLILYAVIAVVRYFAEPRVIGGQTGVNPLFMLVAMFSGFKIFGGIGIFLAPIVLIVTVEYYKQELQNEKKAARIPKST